MNLSKHPVFVVWSPQDESFLAVAPQISGCVAHGDTREEALANLYDCMEEWLESARQLGWAIPEAETNELYEQQALEKNQREQEAFAQAVEIAVRKTLAEIVSQSAKAKQQSLSQQGQGRFSIRYTDPVKAPLGKR